MRNWSALAASVVVVLGLSACETPAVPGEIDLTQVDWTAETINGMPVIEPGRVTLSFSEGRVSGRGGCNLYSGPVEYGRGAMKVGPLISTKMACMANGVMQQESAYLTTLQAAVSYSNGGNGRLVIATAASPTALVYAPAPRQQRPDAQ